MAAFNRTSPPARCFFAEKIVDQAYTRQPAGIGRTQIRRSIASNRRWVR